MTSDELTLVIGAMTERPWRQAGTSSYGEIVVDIDPSHSPPVLVGNTTSPVDARAIVALANHADAFLELVRACEGLGDRHVPQYVACAQIITALAAVHAVGKEGT